MEVYAILFFEAKTDTVISKGSDSKRIAAGQIEQITNEKWADNIEDAKAEALAELKELLCEGTGNWFVGVFGADPEGNDPELLWEQVRSSAAKPKRAKGANTMSKPTYTINYTYNLESGRTTETRAFMTLREATDFVRENSNAAGYVLRQHYTSDYAPACGNVLIKFFGGIEKRLSASEQERLVNLCGTCRVLPTGYAETAGKTIKVLVTGASLLIPVFAVSGIDKTAALVRGGNVFRLAHIHASGAARFTMTGETA